MPNTQIKLLKRNFSKKSNLNKHQFASGYAEIEKHFSKQMQNGRTQNTETYVNIVIKT